MQAEEGWTLMKWLAENKDALLVIAAFLAALTAVYSAWRSAISAREDRRGQIREKWVAEFRDGMSEWLSLMESIGSLSDDEAERFRRVENSFELSFDLSDQTIDELRDAMQELRFAMSESGRNSDAFSARSRVKGIARRIVQTEWEKAREGK